MDFVADLHLLLDEEPAHISARQHPDNPQTFFVNLTVPGLPRAHLCLSGTAEQLDRLIDGLRDALDVIVLAAEQAPSPDATPTPADV